MRKFATPLIGILGPALGGAYLIPHPWIGALLWVGLFHNLRYAAFALLGVIIAEGISRTFRIVDMSPIDGSLKANGLLGALAAAWLTSAVPISVEAQIVVAASSAMAATILTAASTKALSRSGLPPLVLSYCLVAGMLFAVFPHWVDATLRATVWWPIPNDFASWVYTFFGTMGGLLLSTRVEIGLVAVIAVLLWSRVAFVAGVVGWIAGVAVAVALGRQGVIFYWMPTAYNFFLAGVGLGAAFFVPGRGSLIMAAMGGCGASFLAVGLQHLMPNTGFGYLPISSGLTIWIGIYALALGNEQAVVRRNRSIDVAPEEVWWRTAYWWRRSGREGPFLVVPVGGVAQVAQSIDGVLSHVREWRHALDFQIPWAREQHAIAAAEAPVTAPAAAVLVPEVRVIAPAAGTVERVMNIVPDNPPGISNYAENWGNYVVIHLDCGGWVMLAHLRQGSIVVTPGMRVETGTYLGAVGNSGRSPAPHLHLQFQNSPEPGAPTAPFRLANFLSTTEVGQPLLRWHSAAIPGQGTILAGGLSNPAVHSVLASIAPGSAVWRVESDGVIPQPFRRRRGTSTARIAISLDASGRHRFRTGPTRGMLVSNLDPDAWRVLELQAWAGPLLKLLALAVPSIPYAATEGMIWEEPAPLVAFGMARWLGLSLSPYLSDPFPYVRCQCISIPDGNAKSLVVETQVETPWSWLPSKLSCQFDQVRGPTQLKAFFQNGTLTYSLLSFDPGLPFDEEP